MRRGMLAAALLLACMLPARTLAESAIYFSCTPSIPSEGESTTCDASTLLLSPKTPVAWYASPGPGLPCDTSRSLGDYVYSAGIQFGAAGVYQVCLTFSDGAGNFPTSSAPITVADVAPAIWVPDWLPPVVGYIWSPDVSINEWSSPTCTINFGEGSTINGTVESSEPGWWYCHGHHTFSSSGDYTVTFNAGETDGSFTANPYSQVVTVLSDPYTFVDGMQLTYKAGRNVTFTGQVRIYGPGIPVPKATVSASWYKVDGGGTPTGAAVATGQAVTNRSGVAKFTARFAAGDSYALCVTGVTKTGWTYRTDLTTVKTWNGMPCRYVLIPGP